MVLKRLLIIQLIIYTVIIAFLAYLGVGDFAIYISLVTLAYLVTVTTAHPLPPSVRGVSTAIAIALLIVFLYFAVTRILEILGVLLP
ncbi:MAG: hypothetical protein ACP5GZ_09310 [Vulcanisaeta sp.]|uniref:hypothetical protein n=1 Tax=Vulcanisaeta sp. TaxID=2020871 RepID=UPI003D12AC06